VRSGSRGRPAAASGWLARAARLLEDAPPCPELGFLEVELARRAAGEPAEQERHAAAAAALGRELGDAGLEASGLAQLGLAHVSRGEVAGRTRSRRRARGPPPRPSAP
jgi:hypothetical protein